MPMNDFGVTFNPAGSLDQAKRGGSQDPNANVQQAIQSLSLRLPSIVGARTIAPQALLSGGGSEGLMTPGNTQRGPLGLEQIIQMLMGGQAGQAGMEMGKPQGGQTNPYFKFVGPGEPTPGSFTPIPQESDAMLSKPRPIPGPGGYYPPVGGPMGQPSQPMQPSKFMPETKTAEY